ncbi:hypothetical protein ZIOFF_034274 [Zingiber officinale]|uniref:Uncharacterized protein n=1 Tax=Zingiber officinale TaxID=94328 RepID=A0A8J5GP91_ZINOF|nr:hypothetical protein ZIOFF_034274 [Zingiber officinale]
MPSNSMPSASTALLPSEVSIWSSTAPEDSSPPPFDLLATSPNSSSDTIDSPSPTPPSTASTKGYLKAPACSLHPMTTLVVFVNRSLTVGVEAATCGLSNIVVTQRRTGASVEGQTEFEVTVSNSCSCPQSKVVVRCFGISSVEPVDPSVIRPIGNGDNCSVLGGRPLTQGAPVKFKYAWKTPQDFPLVGSWFRGVALSDFGVCPSGSHYAASLMLFESESEDECSREDTSPPDYQVD